MAIMITSCFNVWFSILNAEIINHGVFRDKKNEFVLSKERIESAATAK